MSKEKKVEFSSTQKKKSKFSNPSKLMYILAFLLLIYMLFTGIDSYNNFVAYCEGYNLVVVDEWFLGFKTVLAATIPCLVYASLLYGMGYLLEEKE